MTKKLKKWLKSFTLVELIIVIAIVAILSVAAFLVVTKWIGKSRDARRLSDIGTISRGLELYKVEEGKIPNPDGYVYTGLVNGKLFSKVGDFGEQITLKIDTIQKVPTDPLEEEQYYMYGVSHNNKEYELAVTLEGDENAYNVINEVMALTSRAKVVGNYKKREFNGEIMESLLFFTGGSTSLTGSGENVGYELTELEGIYMIEDEGNNLPYSLGNKIKIGFNGKCSVKPEYENAIYIEGYPGEQNQSWQNTDSSKGCYYECKLGFEGTDCSESYYYVTGDDTIGRKFTDGTMATSCNGYLNPPNSDYKYMGDTGNGNYYIDPDGLNSLMVYCNMDEEINNTENNQYYGNDIYSGQVKSYLDYEGNVNDLSINSQTTSSQNVMYMNDSALGGKSMLIGESNPYYVSFPTGVPGRRALNSDTTIEFFVKPTKIGLAYIAFYGNGSNDAWWNIKINNEGKIETFVYNKSNTSYNTVTSNNILKIGEWNHVAITFSPSNSNQVKIFLDGQLDVTKAIGGGEIPQSSNVGFSLRVGLAPYPGIINNTSYLIDGFRYTRGIIRYSDSFDLSELNYQN